MARVTLSVTVVICVSTEAQWPRVGAVVAAVQRQAQPPLETLVVVDGDDELANRASAHVRIDETDLLVVRNIGAPGWSGGFNTALGLAQGDVVVFLDVAPRPRSDWLATLLRPFDDADVIAVEGWSSAAFRSRILTATGGFPEAWSTDNWSSTRAESELAARIREQVGRAEVANETNVRVVRRVDDRHSPATVIQTSRPAEHGVGEAVPSRRLVPVLLLALGTLACAMAAADLRGGILDAVRLAAVTGFLVLGPGWAAAGFLRGASTPQLWIVAIGTGTAIGILIGQVMLLVGAWSPVVALYVVVLLCAPLLLRHAIVAT